MIACEGTKTEPNYLRGFQQQQKRRRPSPLFEIVPGKGRRTDPCNLVRFALDKKKESERERLPYDATWCVFDYDNRPKIDIAIQLAESNGIKIAFSNPCFELWYLLHFDEQHAEIEGKQLVRKLKTYIPGYKKSMNGLYERLLPQMSDADGRARNLQVLHISAKRPEVSNPSTTVYSLMEDLTRLYDKAL
ncbi:MAG: RloB family protein [Candidatus Alcyoniella australis]|nr:RloB family protein [Candidatus Alcyoniella australis]